MVVGLGGAGPVLQQRRGGNAKETTVRKAMQQTLDRDDLSARCAHYQQRREAAHAAQTSLDFAGRSDFFLSCINYHCRVAETGVSMETITATRLFRAK
jgi:hypothetical protein